MLVTHPSRRVFLVVTAVRLTGLLLAGCTGTGEAADSGVSLGGAESAAPSPEPRLSTPAPTPLPTPTPVPLSLTLPEAPVPQGGSFAAIVQGTGVADVRVTFAGRTYQAVTDGGGWLAVVGAGQRVGLTEQHAPGPYPVTALVAMADGSTRALLGEVTVTATSFPVEAIQLDPSTAALLDPALIQRELAILRPLYDGFTPRRLWDGYFLRPSSGPITDVFGSRRSYNGGPATGSHAGVDFGADAGAPVRAAAAGRVAFAGPLPVRGNGVVLDHGVGVFTGYFHLSAFAVRVDEEVSTGQVIGSVGSSGLATGPHLHWEVVVGGYHVNGLLWLNPNPE